MPCESTPCPGGAEGQPQVREWADGPQWPTKTRSDRAVVVQTLTGS